MNHIEQRLASVLSRHWWLLLLRGLVAIAFGVLTWVQPGISLAALVLLFGAYSMADGVLATWTAIAGGKDNDYRWVPGSRYSRLLLLQGATERAGNHGRLAVPRQRPPNSPVSGSASVRQSGPAA